MPPSSWGFLNKFVKCGSSSAQFKAKIRNEIAPHADNLENLRNDPAVVTEALHMKVIYLWNANPKMDVGKAQLDPKIWKSLEKYKKKVLSGGVQALLMMILKATDLEKKCFLFAISTQWQAEILRKYSSILFLDLTHSTCSALDDRQEKLFLSSSLVKHDEVECGIPVLFLLTNSQSRWPLDEGLRCMKDFSPLHDLPTFMIGSCQTERVAINMAFETLQIRYCHWHMFRAMRAQANAKINSPDPESAQLERKSAMQVLKLLLYTRAVGVFGNVWAGYQARFGWHSLWIDYLDRT